MSDRKQGDQHAQASARFSEVVRDPSAWGRDPEDPREFYAHTGLDGEADATISQVLDFMAEAGLTDLVGYEALKRDAWSDTGTEAVKAGNVSQMQFGVGWIDSSGDGAEALDRLSSALRPEGSLALAEGGAGTGKTATALDTAVDWRAKTGGAIVTNITSWERADAYASNDQEIRRALKSIEGPVLVVLDEVDQYISSDGTDSKAANAFAKFLAFIRKEDEHDDDLEGETFAKQGRVLLIAHTDKGIAKDIRRLATARYRKPSQVHKDKVVLFESESGDEDFDEVGRFDGLTDTAEPYNHREESEFRVVLEDGNDGDNGQSTQDAVAQARKQEQIKAAIYGILDGKSQADVARSPTCEFSRGWVGDRWREWCEGEHRDLVARPDTLTDDDLPQGTTTDDVATI